MAMNTDRDPNYNNIFSMMQSMTRTEQYVEDIDKTVNDIKSSLSRPQSNDQQVSAHQNSNSLKSSMMVTTKMSNEDERFFKESFSDITTILKEISVNSAYQEDTKRNSELGKIKQSIKDNNRAFNKHTSKLDKISGQLKEGFKSIGSKLGTAVAGGIGGILSKILSFIMDEIMFDYNTHKQRDESLNDIMYKYGVGKGTAQQYYNMQFKHQAMPYMHRYAPEQRQYERQNRSSAVDLGYNTKSMLSTVTKELTKWNDIVDVTNSELLNTTMRFIDTTGGAFEEIMSQIQSVSSEMVVTPELLTEVSSGYAKYLRIVTNNNNSYTRSMNNLIKTVGELEDKGVNSQAYLSEVQNFQYMDISNGSQNAMWDRYNMLGYNPLEEMMKTTDEAFKDYATGLREYFKGYDVQNASDRMTINTIAQQSLGFSSSEMQNLYDILLNKSSEPTKSNEEKIVDYTEKLSIESSQYYDDAMSQWTYLTQEQKDFDSRVLASLEDPAAEQFYNNVEEIKSDWRNILDDLRRVIVDEIYPWFNNKFKPFYDDHIKPFITETLKPRLEKFFDEDLPNFVEDTLPKIKESIDAIYNFLAGKGTVGQTTKEVGSAFSVFGEGIKQGVTTGNWDLLFNADVSNDAFAKKMGYKDFQDYQDNSKGIFNKIYKGLSSAGNAISGLFSNASGIDYVPYDNYMTYLHKGERVLTNNESMQYSSMSKDITRETINNSLKDTKSDINNTLLDDTKNTNTIFNKWIKLYNDTNKSNTTFFTNQFKGLTSIMSSFYSDTKAKLLKIQDSLVGTKGLVKISNDNESHNDKINKLLSDLFQKDKKSGGFLLNLTGLVGQEELPEGGTYNPFSSFNITSHYGNRKRNGKTENHKGIDYDMSVGTKLQALDTGVILKTGKNSQYGNYIDLQGANGYTYRYAHLNQLLSKEGDTVSRGDIIGSSGNTGSSTGPHLHLEITDPDQKYMDPEKYFKSNIRTTPPTNSLMSQLSSLFGLGGFSTGTTPEENAKYVYSFFKSKGMPDVNIAGILGNWSVESGVDPTTIEGIYSENYDINGTRHQKALSDLNSYTLSTLFPMYAGRLHINKNAYRASDGKYYPGLGLGQWTGPRAKSLLESSSGKWYDLSSQLEFMVGPDSRSAWVNNWMNNPASSPEDAAYTFLAKWEGIVNGTQGKRQAAARDWYSKMSGWDASSLPSLGSSSFLSQLSSLFGGSNITGDDAAKITDESKRWNLITGGKYNNKAGAGSIGQSATAALQESISVNTKNGMRSMTTNKYLAGMWKALINDLTNAGFNVLELGSYNYRRKRGGGGLSSHSYGAAIDLNWSTRGMGWKQSPLSYNEWSNMSKTEQAKRIAYSSPFAKILAKYNLDWGGSWSGTKDPMHISYVGDAPTSTVLTRLNAYATGGEVSNPTLSMIGEGGYKEYVITTDPQYASKSKELLAKASNDVATASAQIPPVINVDVDTKAIVDAVKVLTDTVTEGFKVVKQIANPTSVPNTPSTTKTSNLITDYA